jgi:hypothetical protein
MQSAIPRLAVVGKARQGIKMVNQCSILESGVDKKGIHSGRQVAHDVLGSRGSWEMALPLLRSRAALCKVDQVRS